MESCWQHCVLRWIKIRVRAGMCHKEFNYQISGYQHQNFDWLLNGKKKKKRITNVIDVELMLF